MLAEAIFGRTGISSLSKEAFARLIALFTLLEGIIVAIGVFVSRDWPFSWMLLLGAFVVAIVGIVMFTKSEKPVVSTIGVTIMSAALGVLIGPFVGRFDATIVLQAVILTGLVMAVMSILGMLFPTRFVKFGPYLMAGLGVLLIGLFSQAILIVVGVPFENMSTWNHILTWFGIVIFSGLVAFDWARAMSMPYTVDNAIDASGGIILDGVNLFIRFLAILGGQPDPKS